MNIKHIIKKYGVKIKCWAHRRYIESDAHIEYSRFPILERIDAVLNEDCVSARVKHNLRDC